MNSVMRFIKTTPFMILGIMMVTSSRYTAAKYGMILVIGSMLYLWLAAQFSPENSKEETTDHV